MTATPGVPVVDIEAVANRQLHRRVAGWLMWPLSVAAAFAVGLVVVGNPTVPAVQPPAKPHTTLTVAPSPKTSRHVPATAGVAEPTPNVRPAAVSHPRQTPAPPVAPHITPKPPAASADPHPTTQPAPTTQPPTSPPPRLLHICLGKLCL